MTKEIVVAARGIIVKGDSLLLVTNDENYWYLPGGLLEGNESLTDCMIREVYEETGFKVEAGDLLYLFEFFDTRWNSHKVECCFACTIMEEGEDRWQDIGMDKSVIRSQFFSLEAIANQKNIKPDFLRDGKWLEKDEKVFPIYYGIPNGLKE